MVHVDISERSIAAAVSDHFEPGSGPFQVRVARHRFRWAACFHVWWINTLGAGATYEHARIVDEGQQP